MGRLRTPALLATIAAACVTLPAAVGATPFASPLGTSSPAAPAANTVTFTDSTGEDAAAPDITTVVVSNNDAGIINFRINVPNRPQLGRDMAAILFLDSDANPSTGDPESLGADYVIQLLLGEAIMFKWDGADFSARPGDPAQASLAYTWSSGANFRISATELGSTKRLTFSVIIISGIVVDETTGDLDFTTAKRDLAPGGFTGAWPYDVRTAPATLQVRKFTPTPARPVAGKTFALRLQAARSDTGALVQGGRVTCLGRVGNSALRAQSGRFVGREAVCTWRIPALAKGKTFRGSVTIVFEGLRAARSYSRAIR